MGLIELFFIAVGLSMDAFAVSICKGLACREQNLRHNLLAGLYFGGFQGLMPAIGWLLGVRFSAAITSIDHWIAFVLLCFIGGSNPGVPQRGGRGGDGRLLPPQGDAHHGSGNQH